MRIVIMLAVVAAIIALCFVSEVAAIVTLSLLAVATGLLFSVAIFFALTPLMKDFLTFDVDNPNPLALFLEVQEGRTSVIMLGGEPIKVIRNDQNGTYITVYDHGREDENVQPVELCEYFKKEPISLKDKKVKWYKKPWRKYQSYIYDSLGLYTYVPFFTEPFTYDLPRYEVIEEAGRREYKVLSEQDDGYRTDHVRHQIFTWYILLESVEVQKVNLNAIVSAQVRIIKNRERKALFGTNSWHVMLDQALKEVTRAVLRSDVTLDMAIGIASQDLEPDEFGVKLEGETEVLGSEPDMMRIGQHIHKRIKEWTLAGADVIEIEGDEKASEPEDQSLEDFGIQVARISVIDLTADLSEKQKEELVAAMIAREKGRALALEGLGEAKALKAILAELEDKPIAAELIRARAFESGLGASDTLGGLLGSATQRLMERN